MRDLFKSLFLALTAGVLFGFTACVTDAGGKKDEGVTSVTLTATNNAKVKVGETITLTATPNATPAKAEYIWTTSSVAMGQINGSSDSPVTTEVNTASLKGIAKGTVTVTVTVDGVKSNTLTVTVEEADATVITPVLQSVSLSGSTSITATGTSTLTASPTFSTGTATPEYTWEIIEVNGTAASSTPFATLTGNGATATLTGINTTTSEKTVTVQVTATYNGVSKTASLTVTIAAAQDTVTNELKTLTLVAESASIHRGENSVLTAAATYSGTVELDYEWAITAVDGTAVSSTEYAALSSNEGRDSRAVTTVNRYNTLTSANKTASNHTVTVTLTATAGIVTKTATATVTLIGDSVTGISVDSDETQISATGTADFTATVNTSHESVEYEVTWAITAVDGTAVSSTEWASLVTNSDGSATLTGSNTDSGSHVITVTATATNKNDSTNSESTTRTINILQDGVSAAYYPIQGTAEAYADTYLELEFDSTPTVNRGSTGTVRIYKANGTLVDTIKPAAETMYGYGYGGNQGLGSINVQYQLIQVIGNKVRIIPHHNTSTGLTLLENSTSYYVLIDDGLITGTLDGSTFAGITETTGWTFTTAAAPSVSGNTITVGDGGNFITVQGAFSWMMANSKKGDWTIKIESGTYYERIFYSGSANITMSGQGSAEYGTDVEIQWCNQDGDAGTTLWNTGTRGRNVFYYRGGDLILENLSIYNTATRYTNEYGEYDSSAQSDTANGKNQAEALMFDSTGNCAAYNCNFKSKQDTIYLSPSGGKAWFYGCKISGDIDFIWGLSDVALFERCNIISAYDARATNTYVVAPHLATGTAPYGKGFVLYNCDITTESGQTTYLARSPWGSSGNISQVAIIDTAVTGGLESNPWYGSHVGGADETVLGWKWYGVTSDGSEISADNKLSQAQYEAEFAGRNNIINRTYDGSAFSKAASTWDVNALAQTMGWNVVTDNSKATLDGESEITTVTYDFTAQTSYSQWDSITSISAEDDSTNTATVSGLKWHSTNYGANVSAANSTVSFEVTGACTVTVYNSYTVATDVTLAVGGTTVDTKSTSGSDSCTLSYTGTASGTAVVTIASSGAYISKIVVTYTSSGSGSSGGDSGETSTTLMWNASDYAVATLSENTTLGIMTVEATSDKTVKIASASATIDEVSFTNKLALGGSGSVGSYRTLKFTLSGPAAITVYAGKAGSAGRNLVLTDGSTTYGSQKMSTSANASYSYTYTGSGGTLYLYSSSSGIDVYGVKIVTGSLSVSSVTVSGKTSVEEGASITLTATPDIPTSSAYTWTVTNGTGSATGSSTTATLSLTGVTAGTVTVTASVDGVTSAAYTVTVKEAGSTPTISASDTPVGFASAGTYTTTPTTASYGSYANPVTTYAQLKSAISAGGLIYVKGMIPLAYYESSDGTVKGSMLPSKSGETTAALDAFVADKTSYANYAAWKTAYIAACETDTNDKNYSLCEVGTLYSAYKNIVQLNLKSNTTLIGIDSESGLVGGTLSISNVSNIAIRNLTLRDAYDPFPHHEANDGWNSQYDGIVIQNTTSGIWIDHCTIEDTMNGSDANTDYVTNASGKKEHWNPYDGQCDIKGTANSVTVSYCKFKNHDKSMLICSSDTDTGTKNVTIMNCGFYGITQRTPLVGYANVHMYNCYFASGNGNYTSSYAIGCRYAFQIIAENNYFTSAIQNSVLKSTDPAGSIYLSGNSDSSTKGVDSAMSSYTVDSAPFDPGYDYSDMISADDVPENIKDNAGAGAWKVEE